ncbi:MAG: hypothetical protein ABJE66_12330 [Deltaproteobacteria bacterium]
MRGHAREASRSAGVWHGAAITARSTLAFRNGDRDKGMELYAKGTGEMDRAVSLAPKAVEVRIPRATGSTRCARGSTCCTAPPRRSRLPRRARPARVILELPPS